MFCVSLFRELSGCCLVVMFVGGGMTFEVVYMNVGSRCSDRAYCKNYVYGYVVPRLS